MRCLDGIINSMDMLLLLLLLSHFSGRPGFVSSGRDDVLQKKTATHFQYSCLENPMDREAG